MSQKAWMAAYTKGSKSIQARLAKIHANNPEFQEFVKKHGFGGNLSAKQAEKQRTSIGVQQTEKNAPTKGPVDREAMIKAAAEKLRDRRLAAHNRASFGGELGGGFSVPNMGFRTYRESLEMNEVLRHKPGAISALRRGSGQEKRRMSAAKQRVMDKDPEGFAAHQKRVKAAKALFKHVENLHRELSSPYAYERGAKREPIDNRKYNLLMKHVNALKEDVDYKGGDKLRMRRGGWVVIRNGKQHGVIHPTEMHAKEFADATRETLSHKLGAVIRKKAKEIARGMGRYSYATESAANRRRIRSWDSAIMPELRPLTVKPKSKVPFDADPPKKNPGVVVGKNDPGYSRARHLARLGLKKAMEKSNV